MRDLRAVEPCELRRRVAPVLYGKADQAETEHVSHTPIDELEDADGVRDHDADWQPLHDLLYEEASGVAGTGGFVLGEEQAEGVYEEYT